MYQERLFGGPLRRPPRDSGAVNKADSWVGRLELRFELVLPNVKSQRKHIYIYLYNRHTDFANQIAPGIT